MAIDSIIFDLDGTLWDATSQITQILNSLLERQKIEFKRIDQQDVRSVTGKPQDQCMRELFAGLPEEQFRAVVEDSRANKIRMLAELGGVIYPGVEAGLQRLSEKYPLYIVSNCQSGYIETFLHFSGLGPLFEDIECWGNTGLPKADNIRRVMERNGLRNPVYVGDAEGDQVAARKCEILFLYVRYGFGTCTDFDADFRNFDELVDWIES